MLAQPSPGYWSTSQAAVNFNDWDVWFDLDHLSGATPPVCVNRSSAYPTATMITDAASIPIATWRNGKKAFTGLAGGSNYFRNSTQGFPAYVGGAFTLFQAFTVANNGSWRNTLFQGNDNQAPAGPFFYHINASTNMGALSATVPLSPLASDGDDVICIQRWNAGSLDVWYQAAGKPLQRITGISSAYNIGTSKAFTWGAQWSFSSFVSYWEKPLAAWAGKYGALSNSQIEAALNYGATYYDIHP